MRAINENAVEVARRSGVARGSLANFISNPKKTKTAIDLWRAGFITDDEYCALEDGQSSLYNNMLIATLIRDTGESPEGVASKLRISIETLRKISTYKGGKHSLKKLFYYSKSVFDIDNAKELYEPCDSKTG